MEARKLKEAEACMAAGAKCTKTGFFGKWKADWESAASEYERAATSYSRCCERGLGGSRNM